MTARPTAAEVLWEHTFLPMSYTCACDWKVTRSPDEHAQHQAEVLAAAGLLVTSEAESTCVHCGEPLGQSLGEGLFVHAHGLQRCQSGVPYGHMGHPATPCPSGDINPCMGYREGDCTHLHAPPSEAETAARALDEAAEAIGRLVDPHAPIDLGRPEWHVNRTVQRAVRVVIARAAALRAGETGGADRG